MNKAGRRLNRSALIATLALVVALSVVATSARAQEFDLERLGKTTSKSTVVVKMQIEFSFRPSDQ